ncbi:DUF5000 domain-containing lipoprotein [uncultured Bacteroides sp.]|uniref:DUF5000 domain-containing lipoprotein n=1 Tax=uncultured Bacteroides sp. TaxID=162156 RepID=UPI0026056709|nr:DUF5000 domain-containing lipoprotein [uncultured Bacteroides sp.]
MKRIFLSLLTAGMLVSCQEEFIGQYPVDNVPPQPIKNVQQIAQVSGGAILSYELPDDRDLLYVQANYTLDTGEKMVVKSSMYGTQITVDGFAEAAPRKVTLYAVDRSHNLSTPVEFTVNPAQSAIYDVENTLRLIPTFGGMQINWENPTGGNVVIMVSENIMDGSDVQQNVANYYSSSKQGEAFVRGYEAKPHTFYVQVKDRWGNQTEVKSTTLTPLYEEFIAPKDETTQYFKRWNDDPDIPYRQYNTNYVIEKLWDGVTMYGTSGSNFYHTPAGFPFPVCFTFDMGRTFRLSRFKLYQRGTADWVYNHGNPRIFKVWGSPDDKARVNPVNPDEHPWTLLGEYESIKPSGLPVGKKSCTDEDIEKGAGGEDYDFTYGSAYEVRYLMFEIDKTWGGTEMIHISELQFWGQDPRKEVQGEGGEPTEEPKEEAPQTMQVK